jgi:hypothetical protein
VQNVAFSHQAQTEEHLLSIRPNSAKIDAHIATELLQDFTKVDAEVLEDHAQMAFVFEMSLQSNHVFLVLRVGIVDLLKDLDLLHTGFSPTYGQCYHSRRGIVTYIVSLFLMSLIATSFFVVTSVARTTPENIPFPRFA